MKMLLVLQVALGIGNALLARPVLISMLHTFSAAALLVVVVILNFKLWSMRDRRVIKSIGEPS